MVERWLVELLRRVGVRTLLSLGLLLLAMSSVVWGVIAVVRPVSASLLLPVAIGGLLAGWAVGRMPLRGGVAGGLLLLLGFALLAVGVGRVGRAGMGFLRELSFYGWSLLYGGGRLPESAPLLQAAQQVGEQLAVLLHRLWLWGQAAVAGSPLFDPIVVALLWALALWLVGSWAGWWMRRATRPLLGLTPAAILLGLSTVYAEGNLLHPLLLLGSTLLLLLLAGQAQREEQWESSRIDYSLEIRADLALVGVPLVLGLLFLAIVCASFSPRAFVSAFRPAHPQPIALVRPFADSLGLRPPPQTPLEPLRSSGMPRAHLLGAGPELSQRLILLIRLDERATPPVEHSPRYYWRGLSYDQYSAQGWRAGQVTTVAYEADEGIATSLGVTQRSIRQQVEVVGEADEVLYAVGSLLQVDQPYRVAWRTPEDMFGATLAARHYEAESQLPTASEAQLRAAGSDYPAWVHQRYLSLPESLPERVRTLAYDLTATASTPYDRALAIEAYLRTLPYTVELPAPPSGRDVTDYFLFELRRGYCDYYATAMVVLARAAGLPARLVVGYATGGYDVTRARYVITEADAHSWPEIYFPGYGWVEFEPTASRAPFTRGDDPLPEEAPSPQPVEPAVAPGLTARRIALPFVALLALLPLGLLAWTAAEGWWLGRQPAAALVVLLYRRLLVDGERLGVSVGSGQTPYDVVARLGERLSILAKREWAAAPLMAAGEEARWLTELYVQHCYAGTLPPIDHALLLQRWARLHRRLWLAWLLSWLR